MRAHSCSRGFTLVEIYISIAIFVGGLRGRLHLRAQYPVESRGHLRIRSSTAQRRRDSSSRICSPRCARWPSAQRRLSAGHCRDEHDHVLLEPGLDQHHRGDHIRPERARTYIAAVIMPSARRSPITRPISLHRLVLTDVYNATSTPIFQYYDQNYTGTSSPLTQPVTPRRSRSSRSALPRTSIRTAAGLMPRTYTTQADLRNLKTNL